MRRMRMLPLNNPWGDIRPAIGRRIGRRCREIHALAPFWAVGTAGEASVLFHDVPFKALPRKLPRLAGVEISIEQGRLETKIVVISAIDESDRDIFAQLCRDVVEVSAASTDPEIACSALFRRLRRWQMLLSAPRRDALTAEEIRGLFAELKVLELLANATGWPTAISSWVGPYGRPQDFALANGLLEIKSLSAGARKEITVSSFEQLDGPCGRINLAVVTLIEGDGVRFATLNEEVSRLVHDIENTDDSSLEKFMRGLEAIGYVPLEEYDADAYLVENVFVYEVDDGFPRIVRSDLDSRIVHGKYCIDMSSVPKRAGDIAEILAALSGGSDQGASHG
jgi:hypothetical protein